MSAMTTSTMETTPGPISGLQADFELNSTGKRLVSISIFSFLFLGQIAYNIGEFPLASDLICYALTTAYLLASGYAALSVPSLFVLITVIALAALRIPFATSTTSWSSFLLLCALYIPFCFRFSKRPSLEPVLDYTLKTYVLAASVIAATAIVQIALVNGLKLKALANIYFILP